MPSLNSRVDRDSLERRGPNVKQDDYAEADG